MEKVVGIYSLNTVGVHPMHASQSVDKAITERCCDQIDTLTVSWAAHRLNGVSCPISPLHTAESLCGQLKATQCKALFTSAPLFPAAREATGSAGIPIHNVFVLKVPEAASKGMETPRDLKSVDQLIEDAIGTNPLPPLQWSAGQGVRQTAFLCSSSGTTGFPVSMESPNLLETSADTSDLG